MAASYKVLSKSKLDDTLRLEVEYTFDGRVVVTLVHVHQPTNLATVRDAVLNRGLSERRKLLAGDDIDAVLPNISLNQNTEIVGG